MWTVLFGDQDTRAASRANGNGNGNVYASDEDDHSPLLPISPPAVDRDPPLSSARIPPLPPPPPPATPSTNKRPSLTSMPHYSPSPGENSTAPSSPSTPPSAPSPMTKSATSSSSLRNPFRRSSSSSKQVDDDEEEQSPMAMLLKRLNHLMVKVGEHEFEKKVLVEQMEKERERMAAEVIQLEQKVQDLKDQNVQLQYKIDYNSEPMLMERLQDITDMRDALTAVKAELEKEIQQKDQQIAETKAEFKSTLTTTQDELKQVREEYEERLQQMEAEKEAAERRAEEAMSLAEESASSKYSQQLEDKETALQSVTELRESLEASLSAKEQLVQEMKVSHQLTIEEKDDEITQLKLQVELVSEKSDAGVAAMKEQIEQTSREKEQELQQIRLELMAQKDTVEKQLQERIEELEKKVQDSEALVSDMTQEIGDYKHDCMELWKINEDLKQQIALTSAETMLKHAELRENALSDQSALQEKLTELEHQLEMVQEQLNEKTQELASIEAERNVNQHARDAPTFDKQPWKETAIRVLTEQVSAAQRELSDAMDLNLHLNNRNSWLEEQYKVLSATAANFVKSEADETTARDLSAQNAMLDARVLELEKELSYKTAAAAEQARFVQELQEKYEAQSRELANLHIAQRDALDAARNGDDNVQRLREELQRFQNENNAVISQFEELKASHTTVLQEIEDLRAVEWEFADLRSVHDAALNELNALKATKTNFEVSSDALADVQYHLANAEAKNAALLVELEQLKSTQAVASITSDEQAQSIRHELDQLKQIHESLQGEFNTLQELYGSTQQENGDLQNRIMSYERMEEQMGFINSERESLVMQLSKSKAAIEEAEMRLRDLEDVTERQKLEITSLEQKLRNLEEVSQENMNSAYEAESKFEAVVEEIERVRAELQEKESECDSLRAMADVNTQAAHDATFIRQDLERARKEIADLELQLNHYKSVEAELNGRIHEYSQGNESFLAQISAVKSERQVLEEELNNLKGLQDAQLHDLTMKCHEEADRARHAESTVSVLQRENEELLTKLNNSQAALKQYEQQIDASRGEYQSLLSQVEALKKKNLALVAEVQKIREDTEQELETARMQFETLTSAHEKLKREHADLNQSLVAKEGELAAFMEQNQGEVQKLNNLVLQYKHDKEQMVTEVQQLRFDVEQYQGTHNQMSSERSSLVADLENLRLEHVQLQSVMNNFENEKHVLQQEIAQLRMLEQENTRLGGDLQRFEQVNQRLEETNRELENLLEKSQAYCEDLSRRCEEKVAEAQAFAQKAQVDAQEEIASIAHANESLQDEIEKLAQSRFEESDIQDQLRVKVAELQAENNVLAARAHRLTQQLSQYTDLPEEDRIADSQSQSPDLWELLSSGMEQLKADLELASKYAASIDASSIDLEGDEALAVAS